MIAIGAVEFWMLIAAGVIQGAGFAFIGPARQAFISDLVGKEAIGNAVVLQQLSMNSTRVVGPSLAGAFIAVQFIGIGGVYFMTTVGFVIAAVTMMRLPPGTPVPMVNRPSPLAEMIDGVRYVRSRPSIALLILTSFIVVMIGFPYQSFLPSIAEDVYHVGAGGLGSLSSAGAIGAVATTVLVAMYAGHPRAWFFQPILALGFAVALIGLGAAPNFAFGLGAMLFVGALASAFQSLNNSLTMSLSDQQYVGRVQGISMLSWSLFGLVALPIGILADHIGIRETLVLMGATVFAGVAMLQFALARQPAVARDRLDHAPIREPVASATGGR
jgi:predicted MFS family arabinose efflux permease